MRRLSAAVVSFACLLSGAAAEFRAPDLTPLKADQVRVLKPGRIVWVKDGKATMPIVYQWQSEKYWQSEYLRRSAVWLQSAVREMTGVEPKLVRYDGKGTPPVGPALFIGDDLAPLPSHV